MRLKGRQLRFLIASLGGWTGARAVLLWSGAAGVIGFGTLSVLGGLSQPRPEPAAAFHADVPPPARGHGRPVPGEATPSPADETPRWAVPDRAPQMLHLVLARLVPASPQAKLRRATFAAAPPENAETMVPLSPNPVPPARRPSRWAGSAYLFLRPGSGRASLAAGGQLGGSQAAARLTYRLNPDGPVRTALAARLYAPIGGKGAEAAVGIDWHPVPAIPFRLSVERRMRLDRAGRSAWSAYAAGGFYAEDLTRKLVVDGYAQAGVVGARTRDLFADGALRAGTPLSIGDATRLILGGGVWGAAQPGVSRIDLGPRASLALPVAGQHVTVAAEGRLRIAGRASPGSGATLTIAADF